MSKPFSLVCACIWLSSLTFANPVNAQNSVVAVPLKGHVSNVGNFIRNSINKAFILTDGASDFLGEPTLARLDGLTAKDVANKRDYYLLALPVNVPMIKNNLPVKYRFVRFEGNFIREQAPFSTNNPGYSDDIKIVSIYPTNNVLTANFENVQEFEAKAEPEIMGMKGGSARYLTRDTTKYDYRLPTLAGISTYGARVRWTFYPAHRQRVIVGNKILFVLFSVPTESSGIQDLSHLTASRRNKLQRAKFQKHLPNGYLTFYGHMRYALNVSLPLMTSKYDMSISLPLSDAVDLGTLTQMYAMDFQESKFGDFLKEQFNDNKSPSYEAISLDNGEGVIWDKKKGIAVRKLPSNEKPKFH